MNMIKEFLTDVENSLVATSILDSTDVEELSLTLEQFVRNSLTMTSAIGHYNTITYVTKSGKVVKLCNDTDSSDSIVELMIYVNNCLVYTCCIPTNKTPLIELILSFGLIIAITLMLAFAELLIYGCWYLGTQGVIK